MVSIPFSRLVFKTQSCEMQKTEDETHKSQDEMKTNFEAFLSSIILWQGNSIRLYLPYVYISVTS